MLSLSDFVFYVFFPLGYMFIYVRLYKTYSYSNSPIAVLIECKKLRN